MPGVLNIVPSGDPLAFESCIRRAEAGSLIVLQPGIHHTRGYYSGLGWQLPFNGTLRGSGMGNTVLQLTECPPDNWNCAIFSGWGPTGGQQSVSDLTVDLNGQSMPGTTLNAVHLFGDTVSIERVRVINGRGERNLVGANPEAHLLACGPGKDGIRCIATISQCVAEQFIVGPKESACMAFALVPRDRQQFITYGRITDCYADGGDYIGFFGLSAVDTASAILARNTIIRAGRGFNWDTGSGTRVELTGNHFLRCSGQGMVIGSGINGKASHNRITLQSGAHSAIWLSALEPMQPEVAGWEISQNRIEGDSGQIWFYCPDLRAPPNCRVEQNWMSRGMREIKPRRGWGQWCLNE